MADKIAKPKDTAPLSLKRLRARNSDGSLHILRVTDATKHLAALVRHADELANFSSIHLLDACASSKAQYELLVRGKPEYYDAHVILRGLGLGFKLDQYDPDREAAQEADFDV